MRINSLRLSNFRCFEDLSIDFHGNLTVLVGNNGSGKSAILDAVSIAIGTFLTGFDAIPGYGISKEDALTKSYPMGSVIDPQHQFPVIIQAQGMIDNIGVSWKRELNSSEGHTTIVNAKKIKKIAEGYQERIRKGDTALILPIISYYGTGRLWAQKKEKKHRSNELSKFTRTSGYIDCLSVESNEKLMLKWFELMTIQESRVNNPLPEFQAVKEAMSLCFKLITGNAVAKIEYNLFTHDIDIIHSISPNEYKRQPMKTLSDGYKNTLSMIADIAYRMALLNPWLLSDVLIKTPGIILIDEVDLHLHPKWQQRIIGDLCSIFPNVQFIVSTHAPAVINSVKKDDLLILTENNGVHIPVTETYGRDVNSILREIMDTNERPILIKDKFILLYDLISENKLNDAKLLLDEIKNQIGEYDPEVTSAQLAIDLENI